MSLRAILFVIVDIIAAYWLYSLAHRPGSAELYLAIGCLVVSVVAFYLGFVTFRPRTTLQRTSYPGNVAVAAGFFLVLAIGFGHLSRQARHAPEILASWISIYPQTTDIEQIPVVHHQWVWQFFVKSDDSPEKVGAYYQDASHTAGWDKVRVTHGRNSYFFDLQKPDYDLSIWVLPGDFGQGSHIDYSLARQQDNM